MNNTTINSDLKNTIQIMHHGQGYPMIEVRNLGKLVAGKNWQTVHYLFVNLGSKQMLEYCFMLGHNGSDYLYGVRTIDKSFDEVLIEQSNNIIYDGNATMVVHPW